LSPFLIAFSCLPTCLGFLKNESALSLLRQVLELIFQPSSQLLVIF